MNSTTMFGIPMVSDIRNVTLEIGNCHKIDMHIEGLKEILRSYNMNAPHGDLMIDTIGIMESIKRGLEKS